MRDSSSHIHIITLGGGKIKLEQSSSRPKSAVDVAVKRKLSLRYGSAAVSRKLSDGNGKENDKMPVSVRRESAGPAKLHNHHLTFDNSTMTLSARSSDLLQPEEKSKIPLNHSSSFPVGAHTSGYYSKLRNDQNKFGSKGASVNIVSLIQNVQLSPKASEMPISLEEENPRETKIVVNNRQRATIVLPTEFNMTQINSSNEWKPEPDTDTIDDLLAQLSDADNALLRVAESLSELIGLTEVKTGNKL